MLRRWWPEALLVVGFAALTGALAAGWAPLLDVDHAVLAWCDAHRPTAAYWTARVLNVLGNGSPIAGIALALAALVAWRLRTPRPLLLPLAAFAATTVVIYALKLWTARPAPRSGLPAELFTGGESYPAGHVVVAIVWYGVIVQLLDRLVTLPPSARRVLRVAPTVIVFATTVYLSFHWLTDDLGAVMIGLLLDRLRVRWLSGWTTNF